MPGSWGGDGFRQHGHTDADDGGSLAGLTLRTALGATPANRVLAGPSSGAGAVPTLRALVADDIPALAASKITSGTLDAARLPAIKRSGLDTATGVASVSATAPPLNVSMHDYAFAPWISVGATFDGTNLKLRPSILVDDGSQTNGALTAEWTAGTAGSCTVRWRYITASDDPTIWVAYDPATGAIRGVWAADDPVPGDKPGLVMAGSIVQRYKAPDLGNLGLTTAALAAAAEGIASAGRNMGHLLYRALQRELGTQDAPAVWLLENCRVHLASGALVRK